MYARTAAFDVALKDSHVPVFVADVMANGVVVNGGANLPISGGGVTVDATAAIRRRCTVNVVDYLGTLKPTKPGDILAPYGREIRIKRGIRYPNGTTEFVTIGTFRIKSAKPSGGVIAIEGFDRARSVSRYRFETPYVIAAGTNYATAISALITRSLPGVTLNVMSTTRTTGLVVLAQQGDPWAEAAKLASDIGAVIYFDPSGVFVLAPITDTANATPVWDYSRGVRATVTKVENDLDDDPGYNGVVVDGEAPGFDPVHVAVYDLDNTSPTYADGGYGRVPFFYRSTFITTEAQAREAGYAILRSNKGGTEQVKFSGVPHPALEVDDVVYVADPPNGVPGGNYVLESFTIPLDLSMMGASTRKRRPLVVT